MVRLMLIVLAFCTGLPAASPAWVEGNLRLTILADDTARKPVVGEMIEITIRGIYDRKIANEKLEIAPTDAFDWIQTRPDDWREERINGLPHIVVDRHLAIWPKRAGLLAFGPAHHRLTIIDQQSQRQDRLVTARPLTLAIGEFPKERGWKLAARALELTDELSTDAAHLADGEVVTRRVTLRALGSLPEHLPPRPVVIEDWLITFTGPTQNNLTLTADGPVAEAVWTWQFRPDTGEPGLLDPIPIPWFDTERHKMTTTEIPSLLIGYASFYTGRIPTGRFPAAWVASLGGAMLAGLALGLGLAARHLAPAGWRRGWQRIAQRLSPGRRLALIRARRSGDLRALRRAAMALGWDKARLAQIDARLYGPPQTQDRSDKPL